MATIVIVEDERDLNNLIRSHLEQDGHTVYQAFDGPAGLALVEQRRPGLVILDWMLPGRDGLAVCRQIRQHHLMPIIMLTARSEEIDRVMGLEVGADDYVVKPFSPRELVARVHTILRRVDRGAGGAEQPASLRIADVEIDPARRQAYRHGRPVHLTPTEFDLLVQFLARPGVVFTRERLLQEVWGYADGTGPRTVDSHVRALRRKLGEDVVRTVHGVGYALGLGT